MAIFIIIFCISIALTLISSFLFVFDRIKMLKLKKIIISECKNISEKLGKASYGLLNQRLESKISDISYDKDIYNGFNSIIKNFNELTNEPIKRICFVGTDAWLEGGYCADVIGKQLNGKGKIAILITSGLNAFIMSQRYRSFVNKINKSYPDINIVKTYEALTKQENAKEFISKTSKDVDAIYITGNSIVMGAVQGLEESGFAGKVFVLCHDLDSNISSYIQKGIISASLVCSTIKQGRDPVIHLFNYINSGWKPKQPRLSVPLELADKDNINRFWDFKENCLVEYKEHIKSDVKPLSKSNTKIRIIVLTEDWNTGFQQIKSGSELAKKLLEPFNAEVIIYNVNQLIKDKTEAVAEIKNIIQDEKNKKIDGIVAFIGYQEIVNILNMQHDDGIPIATFNAEPIGLRSMILWLINSSLELENLSNEYSCGHQEINVSVQQILSTFNKMVGQVYHETESVNEGAKAVNELLSLIDNTVSDEEHQLKTISSTSEITFNLSEMVKFFNGKVTGLKTISDNVKISEEKITVMKNYTNQIISIINIIDSITKQTNLLAINASIEASRTGESGKGFHVIAKEIRELASKSDSSTKDVTILINNIIKSINESSEAIELTKFIVNDQASSIANAVEKINELSKSLIDTMKSIQNVVEDNTQKMLSMKNYAYNMNKMIENNASISTENSKAIETISSAFTQISAQFNDMNSKTKELSEIVMVLYNTVAQFSAK